MTGHQNPELYTIILGRVRSTEHSDREKMKIWGCRFSSMGKWTRFEKRNMKRCQSRRKCRKQRILRKIRDDFKKSRLRDRENGAPLFRPQPFLVPFPHLTSFTRPSANICLRSRVYVDSSAFVYERTKITKK